MIPHRSLRLALGAALILLTSGGAILAAPEPAPKEIPVTDCGVLKRSGATYILQNDVTAAGTCFSIQASGITLDLNGHTITYAASEEKATRHGVVGMACREPQARGNPCGGSFDELTVRNGKIVQGPAAGSYSHAIRLGRGGGHSLTVENVEITISAPASAAIFTVYAGGGARIFGNTIHNHVQVIHNRHALEGMAIKLVGERDARRPNLVYGNVIRGGAQGGIQLEAEGSKIYDNDISQDGRYTNDFCILAWAPKGETYRNRCHPTAGRGIHVRSGPQKIYENTINVIELKRNQEYRGCQLGGAYGIQLEKSAFEVEVFNNEVTARAGECDGIAFRATSLQPGARNRVFGNKFTALTEGGGGRAFGVSFAAVNTSDLVLEGNTFVTDTAAIQIAWEGASNVRFLRNTFAKGSNTRSWSLIRFDNKQPGTGFQFIDSVFEDGASGSDFKAQTIGFGGWAGPAEYWLGATVRIEIVDGTGKPVPRAQVQLKDARGNSRELGSTRENGSADALLLESRQFNSADSAHQVEKLAPYEITVTKKGFEPRSISLDAVQRTIVINLRPQSPQ
jgi:hypothetical protein